MTFSISISVEKFMEKNAIVSSVDGATVGRVVEVQRGLLTVVDKEGGEFLCQIAGALQHSSRDFKDLPSVGDFVAFLPGSGIGSILKVLPRKTLLTRVAPGGGSIEQVLAANVDKVVIASAMGDGFNASRIERYLFVAWNSGALPIVVLTKADLVDTPEEWVEKTRLIACGSPVVGVSMHSMDSLAPLLESIGHHATAVVIGPSGVGKSTLINAITDGERQETGGIRESDGKGRHTTTARSMRCGKNGLIVIDTPGMRELQVQGNTDAVEQTFSDVTNLIDRCRYSDCHHETEPGCAIRDAIESGQLEKRRYQSFEKLQRQANYQLRKNDVAERNRQRNVWKQRTKDARQKKKFDNY